jgi:GT2 family glycosyltransferase
VVVDNASTDGSVELLGQRWPDVMVLENHANLGFARAVNRGIRSTSSELVLLLNPDTLPSGRAIDALAAELRANDSATAAGPRIVDGDGRPELSWWTHLGPFAELRLRWLRRSYERGSPRAARRVDRLMGRRREVDWVTGACLMVRRQAAVAAGLMDGRFFLYFDDVDLCASLRALGGRVLFLPDVEIVHLRGRTVDRKPEATAHRYRASQLHFYRKHHPLWYPLLWLVLRLRGRLPNAAVDGDEPRPTDDRAAADRPHDL